MIPPELPVFPEEEFEALPQEVKDQITAKRAELEMLKAEVLEKEAETARLIQKRKALLDERAQLLERKAQLEAQLHRQDTIKRAMLQALDPMQLAAKKLEDKIRAARKK